MGRRLFRVYHVKQYIQVWFLFIKSFSSGIQFILHDKLIRCINKNCIIGTLNDGLNLQIKSLSMKRHPRF